MDVAKTVVWHIRPRHIRYPCYTAGVMQRNLTPSLTFPRMFPKTNNFAAADRAAMPVPTTRGVGLQQPCKWEHTGKLHKGEEAGTVRRRKPGGGNCVPWAKVPESGIKFLRRGSQLPKRASLNCCQAMEALWPSQVQRKCIHSNYQNNYW